MNQAQDSVHLSGPNLNISTSLASSIGVVEGCICFEILQVLTGPNTSIMGVGSFCHRQERVIQVKSQIFDHRSKSVLKSFVVVISDV